MQVAGNYSDAELVSALKKPKEMNEAIRVLYKLHYPSLENYILNNKGTKDDAADIIQETIITFVEVIQQDKFRGDASIKSFLYSITRNIWLTELRRRSSADNRNRMYETGKDVIEQETTQHLIKREYFKAIEELFLSLGEKCKQLLMLVYYEDMSMSDIIQRMPDYQNEQVLRNKKYKCMKQLEQMMEKDNNIKTNLKNALRYAG